jgi:hypothetical protein
VSEQYRIGDRVRTTYDHEPSGYEPSGYRPSARAGNVWGCEGKVVEISRGHGLCYRVEHRGTYGWYEPEELEPVMKNDKEKLVEPHHSQWSPIQPQECDLCERLAAWSHPAGGFRCNRCPRPEDDLYKR